MKTFAALALIAVSLPGCTSVASPGRLATSPAPQSGRFVWIEAESPKATNFPAAERNPFAPANETEAAVLSGGKWIGAEGKRPAALFAEYAVTVPENGSYQVFARKFWKHGPYRWRSAVAEHRPRGGPPR